MAKFIYTRVYDNVTKSSTTEKIGADINASNEAIFDEGKLCTKSPDASPHQIKVDNAGNVGTDTLAPTEKVVSIDFGVDGTYQTTSTSFTALAFNVTIPDAADLFPGKTGIEAKIAFMANVEGAATGELELYNYTDSASVGSSVVVPNGGYTYTISPVITATLKKTYRVRMKRVGGTGGNNIQIQSVSLILKGT